MITFTDDQGVKWKIADTFRELRETFSDGDKIVSKENPECEVISKIVDSPVVSSFYEYED